MKYQRVAAVLFFALACAAAAAPLTSAVGVDEVSVTVPSGTFTVAGCEVEIREGDRFFIGNTPFQTVVNEPLKLSPKAPAGMWVGTKLQGPRPTGPINALGSFCPETLVVRKVPGGTPLELGIDYRMAPRFALLGLGTDPCVSENDVVYADYQYKVHRLDSIVLMEEGTLHYLYGTPGVAAVAPPELPTGAVRLLNIFRPYGATTLDPSHLFFIETASNQIETATTPGRIPRTLAKLKRGEPVTIVCLGDSVTVGADIPDRSQTYVERFRAALQERFSPEQIRLHNISLGGSKSIQWLHDGNYERLRRRPADLCSFSRVLEAEPDLVTIEFVNDILLTEEELEWSYGNMLEKLEAIGAEIILITPHFTHPSLMGMKDDVLRPEENRPYVRFLRTFAQQHNLALADAASRWEQSHKEGIPYITLLANHYNHPSAAGGRYFVEELMNCFNEEQ